VPDIQIECAGYLSVADVQCERNLPLLIGLSDGTGVGHYNKSLHMVVDITAKLNNAGLVKHNRCFGLVSIKFEIKDFCRRKRIDVMLGVVLIGKIHARAYRQNQHIRMEHAVFLRYF
jgi:hypothetical protein